MPNPALDLATAEIAKVDRKMARVIAKVGPCELGSRRHRDHFGALARAILFQQLAGPAAQAIHSRFVALFDGRMDAQAVLAMPIEKLRSAGLSGSKAASIHDLAAKVADGTVPLKGISWY